MPPDNDLRAWSRMLSLAPPSLRADPDLHKAWVLRRGRAMLPPALPPRDVPVTVSTGTLFLLGVGALGLGFLFSAWLVKRKKAPRVGAYEALAGVGLDYLVGTDVLSAR